MWCQGMWGAIPITPKIKKNQMARGLNWREYENIFNMLFSFFLCQFEYEGFPDTVDTRFLERMFLLNGSAVVCEVPGGLVALGAAPGFDLNINGWPTKVWGYGFNGYNQEFQAYVPGGDMSDELRKSAAGYDIGGKPNAVIGYDNPEAYPFVLLISSAARRIADIMRSSDVACKTMKTPYLIQAEESTAKQVGNVLDKYEENVWTIITTNGFSPDAIKLWPANANPQILDAMWQYKCNVQDDLMMLGGIQNNPQSDKAERLLVSEVNANNMATSLHLYKRLHERERFCEWCNKCFGLSTSVKFVGEEMKPDVVRAGDENASGSDSGNPDGRTGAGSKV
ncbi:MAG: hypothetical protein HDS66_05860 [Bacteroidales bacterium]|nr:hypothetical protein [Bacteroidales bacterium]